MKNKSGLLEIKCISYRTESFEKTSGHTDIVMQQSKLMSWENPGLTVAQWNAEGAKNKKPEAQDFFQKNIIGIICIQETHLKEPKKFFNRGYEPF